MSKSWDELDGDEIIDSRDLIEAARELLDDLEMEREVYSGVSFEEDFADELQFLSDFEDAKSIGIPDLPYGEAFIREDHFTDYARQLAEDIGAVSGDEQWPLAYINWDDAADALKADYVGVTLFGHTYLARA